MSMRNPSKRPRLDDDSSVQPSIDPTYGQKAAFPGLDGGSEADENDGIEYLRMVR